MKTFLSIISIFILIGSIVTFVLVAQTAFAIPGGGNPRIYNHNNNVKASDSFPSYIQTVWPNCEEKNLNNFAINECEDNPFPIPPPAPTPLPPPKPKCYPEGILDKNLKCCFSPKILDENGICVDPNHPPTANAGPAQEVNAQDIVTLDGSGSLTQMVIL